MSVPAVLEADVGIVGAGPGGMAAATRLVAAGLRVVVLDEGLRPGGQIFRQASPGRPLPIAEPPSHVAGHRLLADLARLGVPIEARATVWEARPGRLWFEQDGRSRLLRCREIVLAPGAYDRCVPFPGWTLPGVVTAGAAQVMVRGFGVRPGARALVVGTGPLLLPTVTALLGAGVEVVAALEAAPRLALVRALPGVLRSGARLREAWFYARQLLRRGVRLQHGRTVFAVEGDGRVQRAIVGRVDGTGRPRRDTAATLAVDLVCAGFGLVPSIELGQRLGCEVQWHQARGGWCVATHGYGATSIDDVYAVGEIAGIGGSEVAIAEGEAAAERIVARRRGKALLVAFDQRVRAARRAADALLAAFPVLPGLFELATDDTIVCRCEDVPRQRVRAAAALHGASARGIKMGCRAGMGPCQGRICGPNLQSCGSTAIGASSGEPAFDLPVVQLPLKPVRTATILEAPPA